MFAFSRICQGSNGGGVANDLGKALVFAEYSVFIDHLQLAFHYITLL